MGPCAPNKRPIDEQKKIDMLENAVKTVLVTAAGTATAVNIIKRLAQIPGIRLVTTDSNPRSLIAAPTAWHTTHYQVPLASDAGYVPRLVEICELEKVDALYPIHDSEILAVVTHRNDFPKRVQLPALTPESVRNSNDKWLNFGICREAGLPVPDTFLGSRLQPHELAEAERLIRKPRSGVGSVGVRQVTRFDELKPDTDLTEGVVYQTLCSGPEYTVDVLRQDDCLVAVVRERLETKAGVCTKARVFFDPSIELLARRISNVFDIHGLFCFQVIGAIERGDVKIIDINPRCGGGTALSVAAGLPLYEWHFANILGLERATEFKEACERRIAQGGEAIVCRHYEEVVTSVQ
jgi:carbamoyl-phosphate synthase large subunit